MKRALLLIPAAIMAIFALAPAADAQDYTWTDNGDGTCTITGYLGPGGDVNIPNTLSGLIVTVLGNSAFRNHSSLTGVVIPDSVTTIENSAFQNCVNLKDVNIGSGVTVIEDFAFWICPGLLNLTVNINNPVFSSLNGVLFNKNQTELVLYPPARTGLYVIPYGVVTIGGPAFYDCDITGVIIPSSVTTIGNEAFYSCTNLGNVTIPCSVITIGDKAFLGCGGFTGITIPDSVITIGEQAYSGCYNANQVTIGAGVTTIGNDAFYNCPELTSITVNVANPAYSSLAGVLFNKSQTELIQYPLGRTGAYSIPVGVVTIKDNAFKKSDNLTSIAISDSVITIGADAFYDSGISSVSFGNGVETIGSRAFYYCYGLFNVVIPDSVTEIGEKAFENCHYLTSVTIGASVAVIGQSTFYNCPNLTFVSLPEALTIIGDRAFMLCDSLASITIPKNVSIIGDQSFYGCEGLIDITVDIDNQIYSSIDGVLFNKTQTEIILCPSGITGVYSIPNTVNHIGSFTFAECGLTNIIVSASVVYVGNHAFDFNRDLNGIYFKGDAPELDDNVRFYATSTVYYIPLTSGWEITFGGLATAVWPPLAVDVDENYSVDLADFVVLAGQWLQTGCGEANDWCGGADFDRSGGVDAADLLLLANDWLWP